MSDKSPGPSAVTALPLVFQVAFAPTVRQSSANRTFNIKTLADMIGGYPPVGQEIATALIEKHGLIQGTLETKKLGPAIYFGRYPDGARTRTMQNLEACTAIILDFDGRAGDRVHRDALLVACREHNLQVLIHDSFSATEDGMTYRAIFPCNELPIDCYASAAMALKQLLGMGPKTILPASQGYFFQARPGRKPNVQALFGRSVDQVLDFNGLEAIADGVAPLVRVKPEPMICSTPWIIPSTTPARSCLRAALRSLSHGLRIGVTGSALSALAYAAGA